MKGISTGAYEDERDDWGDALARARREGFDCVELCAIRRSLVCSTRSAIGFDSSTSRGSSPMYEAVLV